ncbi:general secretion pathway protein GspB [Janthinobacterium sp.]|uniref:general secretion pathway protein GspB n=1 Tax=Janthinobacterium sp. TaxID=1871054 RepID=UPI002606A926|nr:general secretion pathway protein GspB [Janthinobacterium sp.]
MSYILEALKKSQAERQLGELPSIHAPQFPLHHVHGVAGNSRLPVWLGLGAVSLAVLAALLWWQPWQQKIAAPAPVAAAPVPLPLPAAPPAPATVAATPAPTLAPAPVKVAPVPESKPQPQPVARVEAAAPASVPAEEVIPGLRDLPEPIRQQIPPIVLGGYIYSKNPEDRLLLIDKVLRHEGEELAPGLVLEKLQPKAAIFNFKGYRYKMPY